MMEASDFDFVDNVSSFLGGLVDIFCSLTETGETTMSLAAYVDLVTFLFRRHMTFELSAEFKQHLQTLVQFSRSKETAVFGRYQPSGMLTQKWHALDHIYEAVTHVGGIESLHTGV